jgi:hypothetical protein
MMMRKRLLWIFIGMAVLLTSAYVFGQSEATRFYTVNYTTTPPTINGVVGAGEWDAAEPRQAQFRLLRTAAPGTLATEDVGFQALCDDTNFYILVTTNDPDFSTAAASADDSITYSDDVEFFIDPGELNENKDGDTEDDSYQIAVPMITGVRAAGAAGPPFIATAARYDAQFGGLTWNPTHIAVGVNATVGAGVLEIAIPFGDMNETYGAFLNSATSGETDLVVTGPPDNGKQWALDVCRITGDGTLPLWNWHLGNGTSASFSEKPYGVITFNIPPPPTPSPTQAGFAGVNDCWTIYE